jgi:hypothetical protein
MGKVSMTTTASYTNRWTYIQTAGAAIIIIGTNFTSSTGAAQEALAPPYAQTSPNTPFAIATSSLIARIDDQPSSRAEEFGEKIARWNRYVVQRLEELRAGAFDFTGLQVPAEHIVDKAWVVASDYFHFNTPPPSVLPSDEGEILFVWHKAGWDAQISVGSEETTIWAYDRRSGAEFSGSLTSLQNEFSNLLEILGRN